MIGRGIPGSEMLQDSFDQIDSLKEQIYTLQDREGMYEEIIDEMETVIKHLRGKISLIKELSDYNNTKEFLNQTVKELTTLAEQDFNHNECFNHFLEINELANEALQGRGRP